MMVDELIKECKKTIKTFEKGDELYRQGEYVNSKKWFTEALQSFHDVYHGAMMLLYKNLNDADYTSLGDLLETVSDYIAETRKRIVNCDYMISSICY